jgi:hypothetical protein
MIKHHHPLLAWLGLGLSLASWALVIAAGFGLAAIMIALVAD